MKKIVFLILIFVSAVIRAQSYKQGQVDINAGIGLGNNFKDPGAYRNMPTLNVSGEYAVTDAIGIGGYLGFTSATYRYFGTDWNHGNGYGNYNYMDEIKWSFFIIGLRGAYHFDEFVKIDKLDLYAGLMLGYNYAHYSYTSTDPYHNYSLYYGGSNYGWFAYTIFAGARYRFSDKVGVFAELGYGVSYLNLGMNFKLN